jgi:hypothetical protein
MTYKPVGGLPAMLLAGWSLRSRRLKSSPNKQTLPFVSPSLLSLSRSRTETSRISLIKQLATPRYYSTDYIPNHGLPLARLFRGSLTTTLWDPTVPYPLSLLSATAAQSLTPPSGSHLCPTRRDHPLWWPTLTDPDTVVIAHLVLWRHWYCFPSGWQGGCDD